MTSHTKPARHLNLIKFARGLNPNGLALNLYNLSGEFVRKGSVKVITGRARGKFKSTDKPQRDEIALSQQRFLVSLMVSEMG